MNTEEFIRHGEQISKVKKFVWFPELEGGELLNIRHMMQFTSENLWNDEQQAMQDCRIQRYITHN